MTAWTSLFHKPVPRRQFLKASSAAAIGFAAAGLVRPDSLFGAEAPVSLPLLGVGFTPDEPSERNVRLTDAASMLAGDPTFISRGARLTITSFTPMTTRARRTPRGAAIDAIFPILGRNSDKYPRFQAWCYSAKQSGLEWGRTSFTMPVTATDGIQLVVRSLGPADGKEPVSVAQSPFPLSLSSTNGAYKLQKGTYVVAFREDGGSDITPNWSRFSLARKSDGDLTVPGAYFSYVVVAVDYAQ